MGFEHREAIKPGLEWNLESVPVCTKNHLRLLAMCQTLFSERVYNNTLCRRVLAAQH